MQSDIGVVVKVDPITTEIVRSALVAITDEMKSNLMRTAYNMVIYEALDFTVGLFDREGNTISIGLGLPMFIRGLSDTVKAVNEFYSREKSNERIDEGDIALTNDSYLMGSHLNHITLVMPIFHRGDLVAFAACMAHWLDIGGVMAGKTTDIYSEGLQLPILKIVKRGVQDREISDIIRANVRFPDYAMGDLRAQIAALYTGQARFASLLKRYGRSTLFTVIGVIFDQSERMARAAVESIPDGAYEADSYMDDDGVALGEHIPIRVSVHVQGSEMTVNLSDVSPQVAGFFNSGATAGVSAAQVAFKCLATPRQLPINDGEFRPLKVILPPGRVVSAVKPAATRMWMTIPMTVVDTIFKALAVAIPERVIAGHHADHCAGIPHGIDRETGRFYVAIVGMPGGGWGAKHDSDGMNATVCINDGDSHNTPVEAAETKYPVLIEEYALRTDSGGAGEFRGGLGVRQRVRMLSSAHLNTTIERTQCAPWGLFGGHPGSPNRLAVMRSNEQLQRPRNGKLDSLPIAKGDRFLVESGGGGGFGDPRKRALASVIADVQGGYISTRAAKRDYRVVVKRLAGDSWDIDSKATRELRKEDKTRNVGQLRSDSTLRRKNRVGAYRRRRLNAQRGES